MSANCEVLVADGDCDRADALAMMLTGAGVDASPVYDGREVVPRATELEPSTVVMDVALPGRSGLEIAHDLRSIFGRSIQLVAYTARASIQDRRRIAAAGFDELVPKAADPLEVFRVVNSTAYEILSRSIRANLRQIRLQLNLAHSLVELATVTGDLSMQRRVRKRVAERIDELSEAVARLPVPAAQRQDLVEEIGAIRARL